jgi:hypothetical protein
LYVWSFEPVVKASNPDAEISGGSGGTRWWVDAPGTRWWLDDVEPAEMGEDCQDCADMLRAIRSSSSLSKRNITIIIYIYIYI